MRSPAKAGQGHGGRPAAARGPRGGDWGLAQGGVAAGVGAGLFEKARQNRLEPLAIAHHSGTTPPNSTTKTNVPLPSAPESFSTRAEIAAAMQQADTVASPKKTRKRKPSDALEEEPAKKKRARPRRGPAKAAADAGSEDEDEGGDSAVAKALRTKKPAVPSNKGAQLRSSKGKSPAADSKSKGKSPAADSKSKGKSPAAAKKQLSQPPRRTGKSVGLAVSPAVKPSAKTKSVAKPPASGKKYPVKSLRPTNKEEVLDVYDFKD